MTPVSERDSCTVRVSYRRSLQDLNQYIGIKLLTSGFLENFGSECQFSGEKVTVFPADAHGW